MSRSRWIDALWLVAVGLASSAWCVSAGRQIGPTFDEPMHLNAGLNSWRSGSYKQLMTWGAMPLPIDVQTLPVYLWEQWRGEPFAEPYKEMDRLLPVARAASLPFWWVLLLYGMRWGRLLGGPWAGRLACTFMAVDPNLLGHAALATTDICLCAVVLVATYHFYAGRDRGWGRRVLVPGLLYGVALTAKASALPYVPLLAAVFGTHHLWQTGRLAGLAAGSPVGRLRAARDASRRLRWDLFTVMLVGFVWAFAYTGCDWTVEPTFVDWAKKLPEGALKAWMLPLSENLTIFTNAGEGLAQQIKHNIRGHGGAYLLGEYHHRAVWYYFPVALTVKLADPTLVLFAVLAVLRPRALFGSPAGWAVLVLLVFSLNTRVQIGVRLVFPMICFGMVAMAVACVKKPNPPAPFPEKEGGEDGLSPSLPRGGVGEGFFPALAVLVVALTAYESAAVWPDGVRYINRLHGGPATGYRHLADSNYDWGQGVPELKAWWAANGRPPLSVWYYGGDPAVLLPPFRPVHVHALPDNTPAGVTAAVGDGYLAVSVGLLTACPNRKPATLAAVDWLNSLEPAARTPTFVIFKFR